MAKKKPNPDDPEFDENSSDTGEPSANDESNNPPVDDSDLTVEFNAEDVDSDPNKTVEFPGSNKSVEISELESTFDLDPDSIEQEDSVEFPSDDRFLKATTDFVEADDIENSSIDATSDPNKTVEIPSSNKTVEISESESSFDLDPDGIEQEDSVKFSSVDSSRKTIVDFGEVDIESNSLDATSDPNKTVEIPSSNKTVEISESESSFDLDPDAIEQEDSVKFSSVDSSRKTIADFEEVDIESNSLDATNDPNKTVEIPSSKKTVEVNELESSFELDPDAVAQNDSGKTVSDTEESFEFGDDDEVDFDQIGDIAESFEIDDDLEGDLKHVGDIAESFELGDDIEEDFDFGGDIAESFEVDGDDDLKLASSLDEDLELGGDVDEELELGGDDDAETQGGKVSPKTKVVEDNTLLSDEFDRSIDGSGSSTDSMTGQARLENGGWGKQSLNATPMSSLEAPIRSKRLAIQPKLNDRLVVKDGAGEELGNPDYRIISFLGAGAMGEVYVARQTSVDRDVAFKKQILKKQKSRRKMIRNRNKFLFEAQITANLDHPNIVAIHDMGRDQDGDIFYCMELVRGNPWDDVIHEMTLEDNLDVLLKVIDGMAYAHSKNTIHRDLKPENTMLGKFGEVLIMDWGLGVNLDSGPPQSIGGTPGFMAPEMASPPTDAVGKHSDIYLLGAILFMITTGQTPHTGGDVWKCLANAVKNKFVDVSDSDRKIDKRLLEISLKAMATDPKDRYANAEELRHAIEDYQSNQLSIKLAERSNAELSKAIENQDYELFSQSVFGFRESLTLWNKNAVAESGLQESKLAYAQCALEREDFELGMSLLDPDTADEAPLYQKLRKGVDLSNRRRRMVWIAIGASILLLGALVLTSMMNARVQRINNENLAAAVELEKKAKLEAVSATIKAEEETVRAEEEKARAESERMKAETAQERAEALAITEEAERRRAEGLAVKEKEARETAEGLAVKEKAAREKAEHLRVKEIEARQIAERATDEKEAQRLKAITLAGQLKISEKSARQRLFQSNIGLIDGNIRDNQIEQAIDTLTRTRRDDSRFVNWEWNRLYHLCHTEVKSESLEGVAAIDQGNNGDTIVVSSLGMAKFWNPNDAADTKELKIASGKAISVSLSRNGKWAAIGTADPSRKLTIWDVATGQMVANLSDQISASLVSSVAFNDSGTQLAVGDSARLITLFDGRGANWRSTKELRFHSMRPVDLDYSADGRRLASVSNAGLSIVWDTTTGKPLSAYNHPSQFLAVKFQPGKTGVVACATDDREIVFWNSATSNNPESWQNLPADQLKIAKARGFIESLVTHESIVNDVDFSKDGKTMVTCGDDRTIAVWNIAEGTLSNRFRGHVDAVLACCVAEDGKSAVSASSNGEVRSWRFDEYEDERVFTSEKSLPINCVQFNAKATQILTGDEDGVLRIWNREKSANAQSKLQFDPRLGRKATYLPKSDRIVTSSPGNVFVWHNGKLLHKKTEIGNAGIVATTKNERMMITGGDEDQPTVVWDLETGNKVATLLEGNSRNRVTAMSISPDDRYVAMGTGSVEGIVSVFDLTTFQLVDEFEEHRGWISDLVFSPSSNEFLSADSVEGYVNAWVVDGNRVRRQKKIEGIGGSYIRIAYSESGEQFVTSTNTDSSESEIQIWDSRTKSPIEKVQLARPIDFVSVIRDEVVFRLTNGKAYGWKYEDGPRQMRQEPLYSNASYPTALNGWARLPGSKSLVYGDGFVRIIDGTATQTGSRINSVASVFDSAGNPGPCINAFSLTKRLRSLHSTAMAPFVSGIVLPAQ